MFKSESPAEYFRIYFDIGYFFYFLPYKFIKSPQTGLYTIKTNKLNKVLSFLFHLIVVYRLFILTYQRQAHKSDAQSYFHSFSLFAGLIYKILFAGSIWKYKNTYLNIFNELDKYSSENPSLQGFQSKLLPRKFNKCDQIRLWAWLICIVGILMAIGSTMVGHGIINISEWSPAHLIMQSSKALTEYYTFFIPKPKSIMTTLGIGSELCCSATTYYVQGSIHMIIQFYRHFAGVWADLLILMSALIFKTLADQFESSYRQHVRPGSERQQSINKTYKMLIQQYNYIKFLIDQLNAGIGSTLFGYIFEAMIYYSSVGFMLGTTEWFSKLRYACFLCIFLACIFISARSTYKISQFQEWLNDDNNANCLTNSKLITLSNELVNNRIGLCAAGGLFTITYGVVGSAISTMITYAVITLQLKNFNFY